MAWIFLFLSWHLNPKFLIRKTSERDILAPWQMIQTEHALLEITTSPNKSIHDSWYKHIIQQESATHADTLKVIPILYLPNFHKENRCNIQEVKNSKFEFCQIMSISVSPQYPDDI